MFCPTQKPTIDPSCASQPPGRVCYFWPRTDTCESCTCTDGKWSCTTPASCPLTHPECKPGTTCTPNTGCGAGRCMYFCGCDETGKLRCVSNPC